MVLKGEIQIKGIYDNPSNTSECLWNVSYEGKWNIALFI